VGRKPSATLKNGAGWAFHNEVAISFLPTLQLKRDKSNAKGVYIPIKPTKEGIIKSSVLLGFQFRRKDLFNKPSPEEMIADKVYKGFVLPGYSEEKRARLQAEAEVANDKALLEKLQKSR
jgi:hypothetical protein